MKLDFRLASPSTDLCNEFSEKERRFYTQMAEWAYTIVNEKEFQNYLNHVIEKEKINIEEIKNCDRVIWVFPSKKKNPNNRNEGLAGSVFYNARIHKKSICIIPNHILIGEKTHDYIFEFFNFGNKKFDKIRLFTIYSILKTVIHEVLHFKYGHDESKVEYLSGKYVDRYIESL